MRRALAKGGRVVLKVGSSSLTGSRGGLDPAAVTSVVEHVTLLRSEGHPTVLVTSGAIAAGLPALGLEERPNDVPGLQVAAAVGQGRLMERYSNGFDEEGIIAGQVLLTRDVLANREQYLHAREALDRMLDLGVVPVVNENDTVVVDELKLGDNDRLGAIVSHLVGASMLIILTDTAGLYSADPRVEENAELLSAVRDTDRILDELRVSAGRGSLGRGGAATKVSAARMAAFSGIPTVIAPAERDGVVLAAVRGEEVGTWVNPRAARLSARKLWIAFGLPSEGTVTIDEGAKKAVTERGRSLLAAGVTAVAGEFGTGEAIEVLDAGGGLVAKGRSGLNATQLRSTLGEHSSVVGGEAIHRDDLVVLI